MHPALKLSSISKLPPSLRARAQAAATGTHPTEIFDLVNDLTACRMPTEYFSGFLPVFYVLLEPARMPEILRQLENPDLSSSHYKIPMTRLIAEAVYSLRGIEILDMRDSIVAAALVDLWDRVSPWILFLDEYGELFGGGKWYDPPNRYALFVGLLRAFRKSPAVERLVYKSFFGVVGKAWRLVLDAAKANSGPWNRINEFALEDISRFLAQWAGYLDNVKWDSTGFDELLFGAGGTRADLASLVVGHINYFVPTTETKLTSTTILHLIGLIESVGSTSVLDHGLFDIEFRNALLSQGIVTTLTRFSIALSHSGPMSVVEHPLTWMLAALTDYLCIFPRHRWIIEALRAGLLPAIFACAAPRFKNSTFQSIEFLLGSLLPTSTVYHSVLSQLRTSLEHVSSTNPFAASGNKKFLKQWQSLLALAEDRFKIVEQYNRGGSISMRMRTCDNLKCLKLSPKKELEACSGCASAVYCSQPCQIADCSKGLQLGSAEHYGVYEAEGVGQILAIECLRQELGEEIEGIVPLGLDNKAAIITTTSAKPGPGHYIWDLFHSRLRKARTTHPHLQLRVVWTPGHVEIPGNEAADEAAKRAAQQGSFGGTLKALKSLPYSKSALQQTHAKLLKTERRKQFEKSPRYARIRHIDPSAPSNRFRKHISKIPRKHAALLFQLRSHHVPLAKHLHRLNKLPTPICPCCHTREETVDHYLHFCPAHAHARRRMYSKNRLAQHTKHLLGDPKLLPLLFSYVQDTERFRAVYGDFPEIDPPDDAR